MSAKSEYYVTFFNTSFDSLEDSKWNVKIAFNISFTRQEALKYLQNENIRHYVGDKLHSITPIKVDESGSVSFGRTELVKP